MALWKRCAKAYELGYERLLDPSTTTKECVEDGKAVHKYLEEAANGTWDGTVDGSMMSLVAAEYLKRKPLPAKGKAEHAIYTELIPGSVYLRCTFDLLYRDDDGFIVGRDYKTFDRSPTLDVDLDFQGRIYTTVLMRKFPGHPCRFEYEYIRRVPPGTKNSRGFWTDDECYINVPLLISEQEAEQLWKETVEVAQYILIMKERKIWPRYDLKAGPHSCSGCFYKDLCKTELYQGELDAQTIDLLSTPRSPLVLPEGY